jgi:hypothetical protein
MSGLQAISNKFAAENTSARNFGSRLTAQTNLMGSLENAAAELQSDIFDSATPGGAGAKTNEKMTMWMRVCTALGMVKDFLAALIQSEKDNRTLMASMNDLARPATA